MALAKLSIFKVKKKSKSHPISTTLYCTNFLSAGNNSSEVKDKGYFNWAGKTMKPIKSRKRRHSLHQQS